MTINEYKFRRRLIAAAVFMAASCVLGRFIVSPYGQQILEFLPSWVVGMGIVSLGLFIGEAVYCTAMNFHNLRNVNSEFQNYSENIRLSGVRTPVDFCFAMTQQVNYIRLSVMPGKHFRGEVYSEKKAIKNSIKEFEERFGRMPKGAESLDWNYMSLLEAAGQLGKNEEEISTAMILDIITDSVVEYYHKKNHGLADFY